jgi:hypothetical protein
MASTAEIRAAARRPRLESRLGLINQHLQAMLNNEREQWDEARAWMQGRYWTPLSGQSEWEVMKTSSNIAFALVETAVASMVPRHPQITCQPRLPMDPDDVLARERYVNMALDASKFRRELHLSVQDCVLCGRSIYKTTWSRSLKRPIVRAIDPRSLIFDLTARRVEDIKYYCEVTVISKEEFDRRVTEKYYTLPQGKSAPEGDKYPAWLQDSDGMTGTGPSTTSGSGYRDLRNWQPWITIYEWYDTVEKRMTHWHDGFDKPLLDLPNEYVPYTLYSLNSNAQDCRGLSEILLVKPNIEAVNQLLSYMMILVRLQIPRILYNAGLITQEEVAKLQGAEPGAWVGFSLPPGGAAAIRDAFAQAPIPNIPPEVQLLLSKEESIISYVSAMAEAARGQVTGARTATELALIEGQLRTRLQARQANVDDATVDVGAKMLYLAGKKLEEPVQLRIGSDAQGNPTWAAIKPSQLADVDVLFEVVPYSPLDNNRAVVEERFLAQLPILAGRPNCDQALLNDEIVRVLRTNPKLFQVAPPPPPEALPVDGAAGPMGGLIPSQAVVEGASPKELAETAALSRGGPPPSEMPPQMAAISDAGAAPSSTPTPQPGAV